MTCIHLAARYGHTEILDALGERVSWQITSTKVSIYVRYMLIISVKEIRKTEYINSYTDWLECPTRSLTLWSDGIC